MAVRSRQWQRCRSSSRSERHPQVHLWQDRIVPRVGAGVLSCLSSRSRKSISDTNSRLHGCTNWHDGARADSGAGRGVGNSVFDARCTWNEVDRGGDQGGHPQQGRRKDGQFWHVSRVHPACRCNLGAVRSCDTSLTEILVSHFAIWTRIAAGV